MNKAQRKISSKVGDLYLVASTDVVFGVFWKEQKIAAEVAQSPQSRLLDQVEQQIEEYLNGERKQFDLPLELEGTEFQKRVWQELISLIVPCHRVITSSGELGGYAGGLPAKEKLLSLEKQVSRS